MLENKAVFIILIALKCGRELTQNPKSFWKHNNDNFNSLCPVVVAQYPL